MSRPPPAAASSKPGVSHQVAHTSLAGLVLGATGIVFGDIGTSPLYTLTECLSGRAGAAPTRDNIFGVVSLIVWSVTMVVTVKYLGFLMRADNAGEGGIMALLALVPKKMRQVPVGHVGLIAGLVIAGAALLFGDGIITPAVSVLSAIEGLEIATPTLKPFVVPVTAAVLLGLFLVQSRGTGAIGKLFGPVMVLWFLTIGGLGVAHIVKRPEILAALSPWYGVRFFLENGRHGFRVLGGVVLAVTGGEALYADMGHFGRRPIRLAWLGLVFPALLVCYLGQGAVILGNPDGIAQPFYAMVPQGPFIYAAVALASMATVIASQALISGVFSLTHQATRLGYFPRLSVKHTSGESEGQIYVPFLNWFLAAACIGLVLAFRESSKLAAAYGLAVSGTMAITSVVYYEVTRHTWGWSRPRALAVLVLFLSFDIPFLLANCLKFFDGGYVPFLVGLGFAVVMVSWRIGRGFLGEALQKDAPPLEAFVSGLEGRLVARVPGTAVFLSSYGGVPAVMTRQVERFRVLHERIVIVFVVTESVPVVAEANRFETTEHGAGIGRVVLHFGFMEVTDVPSALRPALQKLGVTTDAARVLYILGRATLVVSRRGRMDRFTEPVFAFLSRNSRSATLSFVIPPEQVVELGMEVDL